MVNLDRAVKESNYDNNQEVVVQITVKEQVKNFHVHYVLFLRKDSSGNYVRGGYNRAMEQLELNFDFMVASLPFVPDKTWYSTSILVNTFKPGDDLSDIADATDLFRKTYGADLGVGVVDSRIMNGKSGAAWPHNAFGINSFRSILIGYSGGIDHKAAQAHEMGHEIGHLGEDYDNTKGKEHSGPVISSQGWCHDFGNPIKMLG
jgi:hypothetical protein